MSHHKRKDSKNRKHEASDGICPNRDTTLKVMSYPCTSTWFSLKGYPQICHTSFSCTHVVSNGNLDVLGRPERPLAAKWSAHSYEGMWVGDTAIFRKLLGEWSKTEFQSSAGDGFQASEFHGQLILVVFCDRTGEGITRICSDRYIWSGK